MSTIAKVHNIFLDAGGIIVDESEHERIHAEIISRLLAQLDPAYSLRRYWLDVAEAVELFVPSVYNHVLWKNTGDIALYNRIKTEYHSAWRAGRTPLSLARGIAKVVPQLARYFKIGILGQYGDDVKQLLGAHDLLQHFAFQNTQEEYSITKPDPRYYEQVVASAKVDPNDSVMVGDRVDNDIIPAKAIGMKTIRLIIGTHRAQRPRTPEEFPDAEIVRIEELVHVLIPEREP